MPAVSSSLEKIPQNPPISLALRPETIRHPDKRSKLENDATCGLTGCKIPRVRRAHGRKGLSGAGNGLLCVGLVATSDDSKQSRMSSCLLLWALGAGCRSSARQLGSDPWLHPA